MVGRSQHENLKPDVIKRFKEGVQVRQLQHEFPQIPVRTLYRWFDAWLEKDTSDDLSDNLTPVTLVDTPSTVLTLVPFDKNAKRQESDVRLARRVLRDVASDRECNPAVRVQASLALMRMAYLRAELPKHIVEEIEEVDTLEKERKELQSTDPLLLIMQYREMIG